MSQEASRNPRAIESGLRSEAEGALTRLVISATHGDYDFILISADRPPRTIAGSLTSETEDDVTSVEVSQKCEEPLGLITRAQQRLPVPGGHGVAFGHGRSKTGVPEPHCGAEAVPASRSL